MRFGDRSDNVYVHGMSAWILLRCYRLAVAVSRVEAVELVQTH
jgi:hypothetical protein